MIDAGAARTFLEHLWPEVPRGTRILLWTLPSKTTRLIASTSEAAEVAAGLAEDEDVYVGVGLRPHRLPKGSRGGSADVVQIPGLSLDLDVVGPTHRKQNLFVDLDEAEAFVRDLPLPPAVLVRSGGGLQAWWTFHEGLRLKDARSRSEAESLSRGWGRLARDIARGRGREVDATWDLARVMRVPGTVNRKADPRPVELVHALDRLRIDPTDLEPYAADSTAKPVECGDLTIDPNSEPPFEKFEALRDADPRFGLSWDYSPKRRDLQDQSRSGHDQSVCSMAAAEWTRQEVADLLVSLLRRHGREIRPDYVRRTVAKAFDGLDAELAAERIDGAANEEEARTEALRGLEAATGVPVARIVRRGSGEEWEYTVVLRDGRRVRLGNVRSLSSWQAWWHAAMEAGADPQDRQPKAHAWRRIVGRLNRAGVIEDEVVEEAARTSVLLSLVDQYCAAAPNVSAEDQAIQAEHLRSNRPFRDGAGIVYLSLAGLSEFMARRRRRYTEVELASALKEAGLERVVVKKRDTDGRQVLRRMWTVRADRLAAAGETIPEDPEE